MAKTYRRKHLANGRVPAMKTLIDNFNANDFVKLHQNWKFYTDNQKVPNFKHLINLNNRAFRQEMRLQLSLVKSLDDANNLVLKKHKREDILRVVWRYWF